MIFGKIKNQLFEKLSKSSNYISENISSIITDKKLDDETLDALEDFLISADVGPQTAEILVADLRKEKFKKDITISEVKEFLAKRIADILRPYTKSLSLKNEEDKKPRVIIFIGVNGGGKTTSVGKLACKLTGAGKSVSLAACDTFRAAAGEQLTVWAKRAGVKIFTAQSGSDAASLAYKALDQSKENDFLIIDTAGRLQNKAPLMDEMKKIIRVIKKIDDSAPHEVILVLDATTGMNSISQVSVFKEELKVSGLVINKMDGTAKAGFIINAVQKSELPIMAIGTGEAIEDLQDFDPDNFANALLH